MTAHLSPVGDRGSGTTRNLWVFAALLLAAVLAVAVTVYLVIRPEATKDAGQVVGYQAPTSVPRQSSGPAQQGLPVALLRGGRTGCLPTAGCNEDNYDAWLEYMQGWKITTLARGGTGYVAGNIQRPQVNFQSRMADTVRVNPRLVLVEGSVSDMRYSYDQVRQAAIELYQSIRRQIPGAKIAVIGPMWGGSTPPASIVSDEKALISATQGRVDVFIDPIAQDWFGGANAKLMQADHVSPTNDGHRMIAQRIAAGVQGINVTAS